MRSGSNTCLEGRIRSESFLLRIAKALGVAVKGYWKMLNRWDTFTDDELAVLYLALSRANRADNAIVSTGISGLTSEVSHECYERSLEKKRVAVNK